MRTLSIREFSCIERADVELDRLTVIIGPQASGKSVIAKLFYFSVDSALMQLDSILKQESFEKFTIALKERFFDWFPKSAWGVGNFKIRFEAGKYSLAISKVTRKASEDIRVAFSEEFQEAYSMLLAQVAKAKVESELKSDVRDFMERDWRLRVISMKALQEMMGGDTTQHQVFIPAGRSFFTNIGKAIAAFEHGRTLDPLILRFGQMYSSYGMRQSFHFSERAPEREYRKAIEETMASLLGGRIVREGDRDFLHAKDGRKIPLSALSSGQQELVPIIAILPWFSGAKVLSLCYIEEPEAHLFPSTQSALVQALVMVAAGTSLFLTTHSPYVITKINNLLKAGSLSRRKNEKLKAELESLVPRKAWLNAKNVRAYAMQAGVLKSILGNDGLIDGDYLDEISCDLSNDFSALLNLEEKYAS